MNYLNAPKEWLTDSPRILVIGCGGTGSELLSRLCKLNALYKRLGGEPLDVTIADGDCVSEFNIGRQGYFECDIGLNKAEVLANRFNTWGDCDWEYIDSYIKPDDITFHYGRGKYDMVVTCVDSGLFRAELGEVFSSVSSEMLWLDGGNDSHSSQIVIGHLGMHDEKVPNVWDLFQNGLIAADTGDTPSCSTEAAISKQTFGINSQVAEIMAQMVWQLIRYQRLEKHIVYADVKTFETSSVPICEKQWSLYGYQKAG